MADLIRFFPHSYEPHDLEKYSADGGRCVPGSNIINSRPGKSARKEE